MLSRNAKLYLVATVVQGLSFGIWGVIFYLYLNLPEVGFEMDFVGNMFSAGAIATGLVALPAGLLCERFGPKKALLIGLTANFISLIQINSRFPTNNSSSRQPRFRFDRHNWMRSVSTIHDGK